MSERCGSEIYVFGIDVGFRKTGVTVFRIDQTPDELVYAATLRSDDRELERRADADTASVISIVTELRKLVLNFKPVAFFIEVPHGGGQGARALHCMGMAKAMIAAVIAYEAIAYELYTPVSVEKALGIEAKKTKPAELTGMSASARAKLRTEHSKLKKAKLKDAATSTWPHFDGWPTSAELAEDAYDSACAFIAGQKLNQLYGRLKFLHGDDFDVSAFSQLPARDCRDGRSS